MVTVTITIKPYLARYMYVRYAQSLEPESESRPSPSSSASLRKPIPIHLQDKHYKGAQMLGRGAGYQYPHDYPNHYVKQQYLPEEIRDARFYEPGDNGHERKIREWMEYIRKGLPDERKKE